jgi:hypothetical protein
MATLVTQGIVSVTTDLTVTDAMSTVLGNGTFTIFLPAVAGRTGRTLTVKNIGAGTLTLDGNSTELIEAAQTLAVVAGDTVELECTGTKWVTVGGRGPQGAQGTQGSQGPQGSSGGAGAQGPQGTQGPNGTRTWTPAFINTTTTNGTTFTKTGGAAWAADVHSVEGYTRGCFATAMAGTVTPEFMFGLNSDPATDGGYSTIDYAFYLSNGSLNIYESGSYVTGCGTYTTSTVLTVTYDGVNIRYLKDGVVQRTVARAVGAALYFDSSFTADGSSLVNVAFGPMGEQGPQGTQGYQGAAGSTGGAGAQGPQGYQGSAGSAGSQGPQGYQGTAGSAGAQGAQGTGVNPTFCEVTLSANVDVNSTTETTIYWDTETEDSANLHPASGNTHRITVNSSGLWRITAHVADYWNLDSGIGGCVKLFRLYKNGSMIATAVRAADGFVAYDTATTFEINREIVCSANDYFHVTLYAPYWTGGGNCLQVRSGTYSWFSALKVR